VATRRVTRNFGGGEKQTFQHFNIFDAPCTFHGWCFKTMFLVLSSE